MIQLSSASAITIIKLGIQRVQACTVLPNILRSRYVARTPPVEARSPGRRSNVENAPVTRQSPAATRADHAERSHYVVVLRDGRKLVTRVRVLLP